MTVFCNAEGRFESTVLDKPILQPTAFVCAPSPKQVFCAPCYRYWATDPEAKETYNMTKETYNVTKETYYMTKETYNVTKEFCAPCYRYWATDPEANQVKFPAFAALDCTAGMCDPASGRRSYQLPAEDRWLGMRCPSVTNSTVSPCLRVLCRPLLQVDIGSNAEILYNISGYNAYNVSAPPPGMWPCCHDQVPRRARARAEHWCCEHVLGDDVSDDMQWQGILARLPKMCKENVCGE